MFKERGATVPKRIKGEVLAISTVVLWPLVDAFEATGGDVAALLRRHGLASRQALEDETAVAREVFIGIAGESLYQLHVQVAARNGLPRVPVRTFRMMCRAMLSATDLGEAIRIAFEFSLVMGQGDAGDLAIEDGTAVFHMAAVGYEDTEAAYLVSLFGLAAMHRVFGWLIGQEIPLSRTMLAFSSRPVDALWHSLFKAAPSFEAARTGFAFEAEYLARPVVRRGRDLDALFASFPFDLMPPDYQDETTGERVRRRLRAALSRGEDMPTLEQLAAAQECSVSTLRRRLADEGASLNGLRHECRRELALALLGDGRSRIQDIAQRVGFSDTASFRRAFRDWTGVSPASWRRGDTSGH